MNSPGLRAFPLAEGWWGQFSDGGRAVGRDNAQIISFAMRQGLDVFSPSNVPWLNPEVIRATRESGDRNLFAGWWNWLRSARHASAGFYRVASPNQDCFVAALLAKTTTSAVISSEAKQSRRRMRQFGRNLLKRLIQVKP